MSSVVVRPVSRAATPGGQVRYRVRVVDGGASAIVVRPDAQAIGYVARFPSGADEAIGASPEHVLTVRIPPGAPMA